MNIIQISFGRNIGNSPMMGSDWDAFRKNLRSAIRLIIADDIVELDEYHEGVGIWEGVEEISGRITVGYPVTTAGDYFDVEVFFAEVKETYRAFEQDAVGIVLGTSSLI